MSNQRLVVTVPVERIVTVRQGDSVVEVRQPAPPRLHVLTFGYQGPTGSLDDNVLQRVLQTSEDAEAARLAADAAAIDAGQAVAASSQAVDEMDALVRSLKNAFDYHAGAISAD